MTGKLHFKKSVPSKSCLAFVMTQWSFPFAVGDIRNPDSAYQFYRSPVSASIHVSYPPSQGQIYELPFFKSVKNVAIDKSPNVALVK